MIAYLLGLATLPALAALGALGLWLWHETFERTVGARGCYACKGTQQPHPFPSWEIGAEPNWRWHWESLRHQHITAKNIDHRLHVAEHKARWGW